MPQDQELDQKNDLPFSRYYDQLFERHAVEIATKISEINGKFDALNRTITDLTGRLKQMETRALENTDQNPCGFDSEAEGSRLLLTLQFPVEARFMQELLELVDSRFPSVTVETNEFGLLGVLTKMEETA